MNMNKILSDIPTLLEKTADLLEQGVPAKALDLLKGVPEDVRRKTPAVSLSMFYVYNMMSDFDSLVFFGCEYLRTVYRDKIPIRGNTLPDFDHDGKVGMLILQTSDRIKTRKLEVFETLHSMGIKENFPYLLFDTASLAFEVKKYDLCIEYLQNFIAVSPLFTEPRKEFLVDEESRMLKRLFFLMSVSAYKTGDKETGDRFAEAASDHGVGLWGEVFEDWKEVAETTPQEDRNNQGADSRSGNPVQGLFRNSREKQSSPKVFPSVMVNSDGSFQKVIII